MTSPLESSGAAPVDDRGLLERKYWGEPDRKYWTQLRIGLSGPGFYRGRMSARVPVSSMPTWIPTWAFRLRLARSSVVALLLGLLLTSGVGLAIERADAEAERQLLSRFEARGELGASFMAAYVSDLQDRGQAFAETQLGNRPTASKIKGALGALGFERAIVLKDGRFLSGFPFDEALVGKNLIKDYAHLAAATDGRRATSGVVPSATDGQPVVGFAVPYGPPEDRLVFSGGHSVASSPIGESYLKTVVPVVGARAYLVDDAGSVVASSEGSASTGALAEVAPEVARASASRSRTFSEDGVVQHLAGARVEGAPWTLVTTAPDEQLLGPLRGPEVLIPWALLAATLMCVGAAVVLLQRLQLRRAELMRLNSALTTTSTELERSNQELEQFAYVASHDLQEPLRMVSSYVQLLDNRYGDKLDQDAREFIGFAVEGATRMQSLIQDLLAYARVQSRGRDFSYVEARAAVDTAVRSLGSVVEESRATIDIGPLPGVAADPGQLTQLFQNLISNAIKFRSADRQPVVRITAEREGPMWTFRVSDNGIGIEPQYAERIFVIFQRLHKRSDFGGTGIGLSICRRIAERHGGRIWVEQNEEGGSTFAFTVPSIDGVSS